MGTELLDLPSELLIGSTETMERVLQRPAARALSDHDADNLLRHSRYVLGLIERNWRRSRRALASGIEGSMFNHLCDRMNEAIGRFQTACQELEAEIRRRPESMKRRRRLAHLKVTEEETARIRRDYEAWSTSFSRPARPIDWDAVAAAEAAHARGEHRPAGEFEAELAKRAGQVDLLLGKS